MAAARECGHRAEGTAYGRRALEDLAGLAHGEDSLGLRSGSSKNANDGDDDAGEAGHRAEAGDAGTTAREEVAGTPMVEALAAVPDLDNTWRGKSIEEEEFGEKEEERMNFLEAGAG